MSLLDKATIITTPTAHSNGTLHSIKGGAVADFDVVRGSAATRVNAEGLIEDISTLSEELVVNGDFSPSTGWLGLNADRVISDGKLNVNQASGFGLVYQAKALNVGAHYECIVEVSNYVDGSFKIALAGSDSANSSASINSDGTHTFYLERLSGGSNNVGFIFDGLANLSIDSLSIKEDVDVTNIPRLDYTTGEGVILLEPQSTNLITYSEDFNSYLSNVTQELNSGISPSGVQNSSNIYPTTSGSTRGVSAFVSGAVSTSYTISVFAKSNGKNFVFCTNVSNSSYDVWFNLSNGTVSGSGASTAKITSCGNDWYRLSYTSTSTSTTIWSRFLISDTNGSTSVTANGTNGVYLWGAQLEALPYATSYIPTSGAIATRLADKVTGAGDATTFNSTEGVLYAEFKVFDSENSYKMIEINDESSSNNRVVLYVYGSNIFGFIKSNGNTNLNVFSAETVTNFNKVALKWGSVNTALWVNGVEINTGAASTFAQNILSDLSLVGAGTQYFYSKVKALAVFNEALTDVELECLTTI